MITKPAGCAMQLLGLMLMVPGCVYTNSGLRPGGTGSFDTALGLMLMLAGCALLVFGRSPATRQHQR
jgi:hypothetical protein